MSFNGKVSHLNLKLFKLHKKLNIPSAALTETPCRGRIHANRILGAVGKSLSPLLLLLRHLLPFFFSHSPRLV